VLIANAPYVYGSFLNIEADYLFYMDGVGTNSNILMLISMISAQWSKYWLFIHNFFYSSTGTSSASDKVPPVVVKALQGDNGMIFSSLTLGQNKLGCLYLPNFYEVSLIFMTKPEA
jgi:hypothetical protein